MSRRWAASDRLPSVMETMYWT